MNVTKNAIMVLLGIVFVLEFSWLLTLNSTQLVTAHTTSSGSISFCFNTPPEITQPANVTAGIGQLVTVQINTTDPNAGSVLTFFDNTTIFDINSSTGLINFTTNVTMVGNYTILITVMDNSGCSNSNSTTTFIISIASKVPELSDIGVEAITTTTAVIVWITDVPSNSTVLFGTSPLNLDSIASDASFVLNHSVLLTGLVPGTTYFFNVTSCSSAGCNGTGIFNFTTATVPVPPPPPAPPGAVGGGGSERALLPRAEIEFIMEARPSSVMITVVKTTPGLANFSFPESQMALHGLEVVFNRKLENATIALLRTDPAKPFQFGEIAYQTFVAVTERLGDSINEVFYYIRIDKAWLERNEIIPNSIAAWRYLNGQRIALPISYAGEDSQYQYYRIRVQNFISFSINAISGKELCAVCQPPGEWSECNLLGTQFRDAFECGSATSYVCKPVREERACVPPQIPRVAVALPPVLSAETCTALNDMLARYLAVVLIAAIFVPGLKIPYGKKRRQQLPAVPVLGSAAALLAGSAILFCGIYLLTVVLGAASILAYAAWKWAAKLKGFRL